jgi:putative membrane protein
MALASARGLNLSEKPTAAQQRMQDKLAKEQGADFDKAYMSHMQDDHRKAVSLFEKQAKSGDDAELKAFAQKTLPTLQEHHKLANTVHDSVKQKTAR